MQKRLLTVRSITLTCILIAGLFSCSIQKQIGRSANSSMLNKGEFAPAQVGITIFDPANNKYLYNHEGEKLFVPASNTKLFSFYAGLKYLGDSLVGARYTIEDDALVIEASGDPTFLHPDFKSQRLYDFMNEARFKRIELHTSFASQPLGKGWAWDDFTADYMAERDPFPLYGNIATFKFTNDTLVTIPSKLAVAGKPVAAQRWDVDRNIGGHFFTIRNDKGTMAAEKTITLAMEKGAFASRWLADTLHKEVVDIDQPISTDKAMIFLSQPSDSLFSVMMHRSDNFFAEQTLIMVSNEKLGVMDDKKIIDTLLKEEFKELPQKPQWVDGSGLSRYNLFSPQDFVWLLNKMKNEYDFNRLKVILPTGNTGTLKGLYTNYAGRIYAKTGTLSNNVALSGYLLTKQNKTLIFSVLVNNHQSSAATIRKGIEEFLTGLIDKY
jgi:D-alanyl-D-alanine carboxypeptidase/D-alanyl-D-alanine-endopeptidase (penicillin-binding protein 4)